MDAARHITLDDAHERVAKILAFLSAITSCFTALRHQHLDDFDNEQHENPGGQLGHVKDVQSE